MKQTISSSQTLLAKFIFPAAWFGVLGYALLMSWVNPRAVTPPTDINSFRFGILLILSLGAIVIYWLCLPLKKVSIDEQYLYISNYLKEVRVPLAQIGEVTENFLINIHPVRIHLRRSTVFGQSIMFMPKVRIWAVFSPHPVVNQLRGRARSSRHSGGRRLSEGGLVDDH